MSPTQASAGLPRSAASQLAPSEVQGGAPRRHWPEDDAPASHGREDFEPTLIGFTCNWCSYRAADLAGTSRIKYPPNVRLIRLMCSGRLDPTFILKSLAAGADGVLITGCWPGDCHYVAQNHYAQRRFLLLRRTLAALGIEPARVKLVWASAAEGLRLAREIEKFVEEVRNVGPLRWPTSIQPPPNGGADLETIALAAATAAEGEFEGPAGDGHDRSTDLAAEVLA